MVVEGSNIACQTWIEGTFVREFTQSPVGPLPPNGQRVVWDLSNIFRFDDQGRLVEEWVRTDNRTCCVSWVLSTDVARTCTAGHARDHGGSVAAGFPRRLVPIECLAELRERPQRGCDCGLEVVRVAEASGVRRTPRARTRRPKEIRSASPRLEIHLAELAVARCRSRRRRDVVGGDLTASSCVHILRSTLKRLAIQSRRKAQKPSPSFRARRGPPAMNPARFSSAMTRS